MKKSLLISALLCGMYLSNISNAAETHQEKEKNLKLEEEKMSNEKLSAKWDKLVGSLREQWGNLTDQDLEKVKGKKDQLIALIKEKYADSKEKYNESKEAIEEKINELLDKLN